MYLAGVRSRNVKSFLAFMHLQRVSEIKAQAKSRFFSAQPAPQFEMVLPKQLKETIELAGEILDSFVLIYIQNLSYVFRHLFL